MIFFIIFFSLKLPVQLVIITTEVMSSNPDRGEEYLIQHYVITFVSDLRKVGCVHWFPQTNQTNRHDIAEILFESGIKHNNHRNKVNTFREISLYHYVIFLPVVIKSLIILQLLHCHLLPTCHSGEVYSVQHYVIKFVGDLRKVHGFLRVLRFPPVIIFHLEKSDP